MVVMRSVAARILLAIAVSVAALTSATLPAGAADRDRATATAQAGLATDWAAWQREMLRSVNAMRAKVGARPVRLCASLNRAAQDYAQLMGESNHFDHTGPDGTSPGDRIEAAGYQGWRTYGENIAAGQVDVADVMAAWRDSPGHYRNIIRPSFRHLGVGFATVDGSEYGTYWVQNFGAGGTC